MTKNHKTSGRILNCILDISLPGPAFGVVSGRKRRKRR
jgi:hypothetical protein